VFCASSREKIGVSLSDHDDDGVDETGRGNISPSSPGEGVNRNGGQHIGRGGKRQRGNEADEGGDVFCAPSCKKTGSSDDGDDGVEEMGRADGIGTTTLLSL
jgi:hypothetical protein